MSNTKLLSRHLRIQEALSVWSVFRVFGEPNDTFQQVKRLKPVAPQPPAHLSSSFSNLGAGLGHSPITSSVPIIRSSPEVLRLERQPGVHRLELYKEIGTDGQQKGLGFR